MFTNVRQPGKKYGKQDSYFARTVYQIAPALLSHKKITSISLHKTSNTALLREMRSHMNFFTVPRRESITVHNVIDSILISSSPSAAFLPFRCTSIIKRKYGSMYVFGKLPTYPSPKITLTLTSQFGQNVDLGEG